MASQPKKLRILCLHGFTQNEWKFADSVAKISEGLKDMVEFTFLTGTTVLPSKSNKDDNSDNKSQENDDPKKSRTCWWRSNDDNSVYVGLQDAIMAVSKAIEEKGPFDGIMGYSQGGVLSAIIVGIMNDKDNCLKLDNVKIDKDALKFVWINCGFIGRAKNVKPLFFDKDENKKKFENIKCLICCSKDDKYVEMQKTLDVAQLFVDPVIIEYDGYKIKTESDINTKYAELKVLFDELSKASEDKSIDVIDEKMKSVNDAIKFIKPELRSGGHFVPDDADTILKYKDFFKQFL